MTSNYKQRPRITKALLLIALTLFGAGIWYLIPAKEGIYDYKASYDREAVLHIFKNNMQWLVASHDYSVEYMLDTHSSSKELKHKGNLTLKVYRLADNKTVGFLAYHKKNFYEGKVLFVAVDEQFRGKGYARALLSYALDSLKKQGCTVVSLVTRVANERGRKLYTGMSFIQSWTDGYFIGYKKQL